MTDKRISTCRYGLVSMALWLTMSLLSGVTNASSDLNTATLINTQTLITPQTNINYSNYAWRCYTRCFVDRWGRHCNRVCN